MDVDSAQDPRGTDLFVIVCRYGWHSNTHFTSGDRCGRTELQSDNCPRMTTLSSDHPTAEFCEII